MGGGIYYNLNRPVISNLRFNGNSAKYGPNIASYPVKVVSKNTHQNKISLEDVASGLDYNQTLYFELVDYDDQVMNLENSKTVKIVPNEDTSSVRGTDFAKLNAGVAEFDNLIFRAEAGKKDVLFR